MYRRHFFFLFGLETKIDCILINRSRKEACSCGRVFEGYISIWSDIYC